MNGEKKFQKPWKTMPKFGHGNGNWSKTKDLLYIPYNNERPWSFGEDAHGRHGHASKSKETLYL